MKKLICTALALLMLTVPAYAAKTVPTDTVEISAPSAILMDKVNGDVT